MHASAEFAESQCRLCGSGGSVFMQRPEFSIRRCGACSTLWCDPLRFNDTFNPDNEDAYLEVDDAIAAENALRVEFVEAHAPPSSHERLVEIGCMHGDFVEQARHRGYDALGLDLSETAVEHAAKHRPTMVEYGTLGDAQADGSLDVVAGFNVVEHMEDPGEFLDHVHRVLRPGGWFFAETPAQESLYHWAFMARGFVQSKAARLEVGMHPGTHIFKFGKKAWRNVLERRGFSVATIQSKSTPLRELLAKNKRAPLLFRGGIVGVGALARATGLGNRVLIAGQRR